MGNGEREGVAKKFFCAMGFFCAAGAFRPLARVFEPRSFKRKDHKEHKEAGGYSACARHGIGFSSRHGMTRKAFANYLRPIGSKIGLLGDSLPWSRAALLTTRNGTEMV